MKIVLAKLFTFNSTALVESVSAPTTLYRIAFRASPETACFSVVRLRFRSNGYFRIIRFLFVNTQSNAAFSYACVVSAMSRELFRPFVPRGLFRDAY